MNLIPKTIYCNNTPRGQCHSIGFSQKTGAIKYLFCSTYDRVEFVINTSAVLSVHEYGIELSRLRPVVPKNILKLFLGQPVYTYNGIAIGNILEIKEENLILQAIITDNNISIPFTAVQACNDAVILRKKLPYPLGQRIPTTSSQTVTRPILRSAIQEKSLIKFTLSLAPFACESNIY